jgi:hypothetical protein
MDLPSFACIIEKLRKSERSISKNDLLSHLSDIGISRKDVVGKSKNELISMCVTLTCPFVHGTDILYDLLKCDVLLEIPNINDYYLGDESRRSCVLFKESTHSSKYS